MYSVSAVIPTFNNKDTIAKCIESLLAQTYKYLDIWVVDGNSKDATAAVAKKYPIHVIVQRSSRSEARNVGIKKSKGDILFFVESDGYYPKDYVEKCVKFMVNNKLASTLGIELLWNKNQSWVTKAQNAERVYASCTRKPMGGWFYRRDYIKKVGLFKNIHIGEDVEFANRFRRFGRIEWCRNTEWYHKYPATLTKLIKKNFWTGTHLKYFLKETKAAYEPILKAFYFPLLITLWIVVAFFRLQTVAAIATIPLFFRYAKFLVITFENNISFSESAPVIVLWLAKSLGKIAGILASIFISTEDFGGTMRKSK